MIVLASTSASRRAMLQAAGVPFEAVPADIDERAIEAEMDGAKPGAVALALAEAKAVAVSRNRPGATVIGSDSLVSCAGRRFDKPRTRSEAAEHLAFFSGKRMELHSAAAIARGGIVTWSHADRALLDVRNLSAAFIERYLAAEWPAVAGCVGVFRIEGPGVQLFTAIVGDHFTVLGMPLLPVLGALRDLEEMPT